ncbi:ankyrin repeat domain-containing protein [Rickettsia endosymbiont of Cantharis rufa]|uniref:ankyrin repeat domain-containing protein n=1 Tax=Rickettsia endosymbiont of Cantharis rufa TaxID=3066248 RepID=UPI003132F6D0
MPRNNIDEKLPDGSTILHNTVKEGNEKLISLLIQQGHSVHIEDAEGKNLWIMHLQKKLKKC